jgi:hypothetical protein
MTKFAAFISFLALVCKMTILIWPIIAKCKDFAGNNVTPMGIM